MITGKLKRVVTYILIITLNASPFTKLLAADLAETGRASQTFGEELVNGYNSAATQFDSETGELTMPTMQNGTFSNTNTTSINVNELFPGTSGSSGYSMSTFFPDAATPNVTQLQGVSSDADNLDDTGLSFQAGLYDDALSVTPSTTGSAYKVMIDMANQSRPDLTNDPVFNLTNEVYANIDDISAEFGDCSSETSFFDAGKVQHIPDYQTCDRVIKPVGDCTIIHDLGLKSEIFDIYVGAKGRVYLTVEFDLKNGTWKTVSPTDGVAGYFKGVVPKMDYNEWCTGGDGYASKTIGKWDWAHSGIPGPLDSTVVYSVLQQPSCSNDLVGRVRIRDTKGGSNPKFVLAGRFQFALLKKTDDSWYPQSCINDVLEIGGEFCSGTVQVTEGAKTSTECVTIGGWNVCPGDPLLAGMEPSPLPGIPDLAKQISVSEMDCSFNVGQMDCYIDASGEEQCPYNDGSVTNTCTSYEANPQCGFISSSCVDGALSSSGTCHVNEEIWDCGEDVTISDVGAETTIECAGEIRCMGADCLDPKQTASTSFASTAALLNAAQFMTQDMNCTESATSSGGDANIDVGCEVFSGQPYTCKIAVGGVQDCCDVPTNTSPGTYIAAMFQMSKLDTSLMALEDGSILKGTYQTLREPIVNTVSKVTEPFASHAENISGSVTEFFDPVTTFVDELKQQIKDAIADTINEMLGETASNMGTDAATAAAAEQASGAAADSAGQAVVENIASAASTVMMVYTIYVVAVMVIQMIYACEQDEFILAAKKDTKSCTYVGSYCKSKVLGMCIEKRKSYCCYNSPLSRIINEQIRPQLAKPFGDPKNPDCQGIPMDQIADIDWSLVDLGEWTGLLTQYNLLPDANSITLDSITGSGNDLNSINGTRVDTGTRTEQRLDGIDIDAIRREAADNTVVNPTGQ